MCNKMLLCQKSQRVTQWLFSYDFLNFNAKKTIITNLLFEKCQTLEHVFFLDFISIRVVIPMVGAFSP
jgi:hypothetical protein